MTINCMVCGGEFERVPKRGTQVVFCSDECRKTDARSRSALSYVKNGRDLCGCGGWKVSRSKACRKCSWAAADKHKPKQCVVCGLEYFSNNRKSKCCGALCGQIQAARATQLKFGITHVDEARKRLQARRRIGSQARWRKLARVGGKLEAGRWKRIGERDGWVCWLCSTPVDPNAPLNSRLGPTADHVVPLAEGGTDDDANLRLAHRSCNCRRRQRGRLTKFKRMEAA